MSYDISLVINTGVEDKVVAYVGNYTYNVSPMYKESLGYTLSALDGKEVMEVIDELEEGYVELTNYPDKYKRMNPENGMGNYKGAVEYLKNIIDTCWENPKCKIRVS